ncbi:hypothetical protein BDN70DRAFT_881961 [Pholiota conissans]|uniref:MYND-type domain-containing protein n=1 Tax=Pholiota conissans TaxID=109636 RepID=A0A9P5YY26_9AGAR|nr:hypothetical protein BDN70DRAFT_881961 [Pholiota conissans]
MAVCAICAHPAPVQCAACRKVAYCGEEHQKVGWTKHKKLCKILQKIERGEPAPDPKTYCGLCGTTSLPMRLTRCCGRTVCEEMDETGWTYERGSCLYNHDRYTLCDHHHEEEHGGDWKTCTKCVDYYKDPETVAWLGTNRSNFLDDVLPNPPIFTPKHCSQCGKVVKKHAESHTGLPSGGMLCYSCKPFN